MITLRAYRAGGGMEGQDAHARGATEPLGRAGPLVAVLLAGSSSQLLTPSRGLLSVFSLAGMHGAFSKERPDTRQFGRNLCDAVRREFTCAGFFTTDELPRYGLTTEDAGRLFRLYRGADPARDVLVVMTYPRPLAARIRRFLVQSLGATVDRA